MVAEDDEMSKDKEIYKLMALISLSSAGYENPRIGNIAGARETVGSTVVQKSGIQCYNYKEFGHVDRECQKPKRAKDVAYHREKMLLCKQEKAGIQLNAEQADWRDDTDDDELEDQELEAHYITIAKDANNVIIDLLDMSYDKVEIDQDDDDNDPAKERELLASLIEKLKCEIDESKNRNKFLETSNKVLIEKLKAPESDEVIRLEKESRSKLSDLIRPFDYNKLNNLYDLLVPQRENSSEQRYFSERSRLSHTYVNNGNSKEYFSKQTTLLEKKMDESIPLDKKYEVTNLQCDYLELLEKCEGLETELSKSKMMSKSFESVQKHAINLELELQQCKKKIKNDMIFKVNKSKDFCKEREQYFEIQDLKAQLQDKGIVI
nr:hypothetical protein [Tanacetum cinerariifolium]